MTAIVCMALSAAGLVIAVMRGTKGRFRSALRWFGAALVPVGLYLTGLVTAFDRIGRALCDWAANLAFDPRVWIGVVMLAAAVLLLLATGLGRGRSAHGTAVEAAKPGKGTAPGRQPAAVKGAGSVPAVTSKNAKKQSADDLGDFSDIEEILKRRGI